MISKIDSTPNNITFGRTMLPANKYMELVFSLPKQLADGFYCKTSINKGTFSPKSVIREMQQLRTESATWPKTWNQPGDKTILNIIESDDNTHVIAETKEADLKIFEMLKNLFGSKAKYVDDFSA